MATERQSPDVYVIQTNLDGTIADIQDDPDSPDANWADAIDHGASTIAHISFPTPTGNPTTGADKQEFKIWVKRSRDKSNLPNVRIVVFENGNQRVLGPLEAVNSLSGELFTSTWNANLLTNADGSGVECYVLGDASSGNPANRESVSVGAVEWNVDYTTGPTTGFNKVFYTEEPPTPSAWNQVKREAGTGWRKQEYS